MREIERLEREIKEGLSLIDRIHSAIDDGIEKIGELKKEDEVNPVFPEDGQESFYVSPRGEYAASKLGLSFYSQAAKDAGERWLEARKYVIEAINQANGGDNGFKSGQCNFIITVDTTKDSDGEIDSCNDYQNAENAVYFRDEEGANKLFCDSEFMENYKTMLGIK